MLVPATSCACDSRLSRFRCCRCKKLRERTSAGGRNAPSRNKLLLRQPLRPISALQVQEVAGANIAEQPAGMANLDQALLQGVCRPAHPRSHLVPRPKRGHSPQRWVREHYPEVLEHWLVGGPGSADEDMGPAE